MSEDVRAHVRSVAIASRRFLNNPSEGIDPLEAFDAANECRHGNVPGATGICACFEVSLLTIKDIERYVGADYNWVSRRLRKDNLSVRGSLADRRSKVVYDKSVALKLQQEREAFEATPLLGDYLTKQQIAGQLGKSYLWVAKNLFGLSFQPEKRRDASQKIVDAYNPSVIAPLKLAATRYPDSGDWLTIHGFAIELGLDYEWVATRVKCMNVHGEIRIRRGYGKPMVHYPPHVLERLRKLRIEVNVADGWFTENALCDFVGRSANWVRSLIRVLESPSEVRLDVNLVPRVHYSPEMAIQMKRISLLQDQIKDTHGPGLVFKLSLLDLVVKCGQITVADLAKLQMGNSSVKHVYDAMLWLKKRGFVETRKTGKTNSWSATPAGRALSERV